MADSGVERSIGRLEGKIDLIVNQVSGLRAEFMTLEAGRLSKLERDFANLIGRLTAIMAGVSIAVSLGVFLLQKYVL